MRRVTSLVLVIGGAAAAACGSNNDETPGGGMGGETSEGTGGMTSEGSGGKTSEAPCENGELDDNEAGVDCGGACDALCEDGETCDEADDCESGVCEPDSDGAGGAGGANSGPNKCQPARCGDGVENTKDEECDEGELNVDDCAYGETSCAVCSTSCKEIAGAPHFCGDGMLDEGEACDGGICADDCTALTSCADIKLNNAAAVSGNFKIDRDGAGPIAEVDVFCDMSAEGVTAAANTVDWGLWGSNITLLMTDHGEEKVGSMVEWTAACEAIGKTNYSGSWRYAGDAYGDDRHASYALATSYWKDLGSVNFPEATYDDLLILHDSQSSNCWAHNAEEGSMSAFGGPVGDGYSYCRGGTTAEKRYHIYLCVDVPPM